MATHYIAAAVLLAVSSPAAAAPARTAHAVTAPTKGKPVIVKKAEPFDLDKMMELFDKIFPAQPDPLPQRLALSSVAVKSLFPDGTYVRMVGGMMSGVVDRVMGLSESDFGKKVEAGKAPTTLRQQLMKDDPYFEERMRISERVLTEEMGKVAAVIEPRLREGLARSMARRFDEKQLADLNSFLATDSGRAFGSQSMAMWIDSDVMRSMLKSFPEIMTAMPAAMKRLETETAHLPKPNKDSDKKKK